jgi:predicted metal-dependent hydrolase
MKADLEKLKQIYEKTIVSVKNPRPVPTLKIEFYPYVGINNRIRLRGETILVRISDVLRDAPLEIHQALAEILLRKLYRKKIPADVSKTFNDFVKQTEIRQKSTATRKERGRKILRGAQGKHYDLDEIFNLLNEMYFENLIPKPALTWSTKSTYRMLGHYDPTHQAISISQSLDDPRVPSIVIGYVVYHEMLHIKHPTRFENGRRYSHTPAFRRDEREYLYFEEAESWIENHWGELSQGKRQKVKGKKSFLRRWLDF